MIEDVAAAIRHMMGGEDNVMIVSSTDEPQQRVILVKDFEGTTWIVRVNPLAVVGE